jgi:hypothetical protein
MQVKMQKGSYRSPLDRVSSVVQWGKLPSEHSKRGSHSPGAAPHSSGPEESTSTAGRLRIIFEASRDQANVAPITVTPENIGTESNGAGTAATAFRFDAPGNVTPSNVPTSGYTASLTVSDQITILQIKTIQKSPPGRPSVRAATACVRHRQKRAAPNLDPVIGSLSS